MNELRIGISCGDLNGIGLEVLIKALDKKISQTTCAYIVYVDQKSWLIHSKSISKNLPFTEVKNIKEIQASGVYLLSPYKEEPNIQFGIQDHALSKFSIASLELAAKHLKENILDALVTAPIDKKNMQEAGFTFPGHTEYLDALSGINSVMLMVQEKLRVGVLTGHIPLSEVASNIKQEDIVSRIVSLDITLRIDFGIERPKIAVLGLNPHAGERGMLGKEEMEIITPAIKEANKQGMDAQGPFPADGFFGSSTYKQYDAILAMYHDQGLVPFKALSFGSGVNYTSGLPFVRTSPDHGTAFGIAGKGIAKDGSFLEALQLAETVVLNRRLHQKKLDAKN